MSTNKVLSICVPSYNADKTLEKCLKSLLDIPSREMIEIIVVNDGSTDKTPSIADYYKKNYPNNIIVIDKNNGGHGSTINAARKVASGKYFKVVDSDDWLEKGAYSSLVDVLIKEDADIVLTSTDLVNENGNIIGRINPYFNKNITSGVKMSVKDEIVQNQLRLTMAGMTIRTRFIQDSAHEIDENSFFVDVEYALYYFLYAETIYVMNRSLYQYAIGSATQSVNIMNKQKRRDQHLNVCKNLICYYNSINNTDTRRIIKNNILYGVIMPEYNLILSLQDTMISKRELKEFDSYLKDHNSDLYCEVESFGKGWKTILLSVMRKTHYYGYSLIHFLLKKELIKHA